MQVQSETAAIGSAYPEQSLHQILFTIRQFAQVEPAWTEAALRNLVFKAEARKSSKGEIPGNGLLEAGAIVRRGRKVLIHRPRFLTWVEGAQ